MTSRLKRKLGDLGIDPSSSKANESFCLVSDYLNFVCAQLMSILLDWNTTSTAREIEGHWGVCTTLEARGPRREGPTAAAWCLHRRLLRRLLQHCRLEGGYVHPNVWLQSLAYTPPRMGPRDFRILTCRQGEEEAGTPGGLHGRRRPRRAAGEQAACR